MRFAQAHWILPDPADATKSIHKPDSDADQLLSSWRLHQTNNNGVRFAQGPYILPDPADATVTFHKPLSETEQLLSSWRLA